MHIILPILLIITAYLLGSIPFGLLIGKLKGIDIRTQGSHNIGATNAVRTLGKKLGILVFFLDAIKTALLVALIKFNVIIFPENTPQILSHPLLFGLVGIIGHLFPIFLKFKGGKGVSSIAGVVLTYSFPIAFIALCVFFIVFFITKIVSISSISAAFTLIIVYLILHFILPLKFNDPIFLTCLIVLFFLVLYTHRSNIKRLLKGEENKFTNSKK